MTSGQIGVRIVEFGSPQLVICRLGGLTGGRSAAVGRFEVVACRVAWGSGPEFVVHPLDAEPH
jgi:hypothetical protein